MHYLGFGVKFLIHFLISCSEQLTTENATVCNGFVKVAAVVGRADLLSALCFMSAFISYVCAVQSGLSACFVA